MTQTFAATVTALIQPLEQAREALLVVKAELASYDHPLYSGPCDEIVNARTFVENAIEEASRGVVQLAALQKRLVAGDPPRLDAPPLEAAPGT
jgi:hypothetical protein